MNPHQATQSIIKFNRATKEDTLIWTIHSSTNPSSLSGSERLVDNVYVSKVLDKTIRLYKYEEKWWYEEERYEWRAGYRLELIDVYGKSIWEFPADAVILDLYESVRFKTSGIDQFFDDFLIMKIIIDFSKNKSADKTKSFEEAETFYKKNKSKLDSSIRQGLELPNVSKGATLTIPTGHYENKGNINGFVFFIENLNGETCTLSLTETK